MLVIQALSVLVILALGSSACASVRGLPDATPIDTASSSKASGPRCVVAVKADTVNVKVTNASRKACLPMAQLIEPGVPHATDDNLRAGPPSDFPLGADVDILFTPHLLPVSRGILATISVPLTSMPGDPLAIWQKFYMGECFVEVTPDVPSLRDVVRRNVARISVRRATGVRQPTLIVISAIDNLMKGAAGQAVQNANLALGIAEATGLPH